MATIVTSPKPKVRHKSFLYRTALSWREGRSGLLSSDSRPDLPVSSPPEFRGEPGLWTPEDLFVAALESCTMTTFLALAERAGLKPVSYRSQAEGVLEFRDGSLRFTRITIRPSIRLERPEDEELARETIARAHRQCLIANSIRAEVVVEPEIVDSVDPAPLAGESQT